MAQPNFVNRSSSNIIEATKKIDDAFNTISDIPLQNLTDFPSLAVYLINSGKSFGTGNESITLVSFTEFYKGSVENDPRGNETFRAQLMAIRAKLDEHIKDALGPMQYSETMQTYLARPDLDNREASLSHDAKLVSFVRMLRNESSRIRQIMRNFATLDQRLHEHAQANIGEQSEKLKTLVNELAKLQANALLTLITKPTDPKDQIPQELLDALVRKIQKVNELLVKPEQAGGSNFDHHKYLKYKTKYLNLRRQH